MKMMILTTDLHLSSFATVATWWPVHHHSVG